MTHTRDYKIVMSNDRMGFRKTFEIRDSASFALALLQAQQQLQEQGYDADNFDVAEVTRRVNV